MTAFTHTTIRVMILAEVEDSSDRLADNLDTILSLGQDRLQRDLNLEIFKTTDTITLAQGSTTFTKPSGCLAVDTISYVSSGTTVYLTPKTYEYCLDYWPVASTQGTPLFFADLNDAQWYVAPTPNGAYTGTARFIKRMAPLTASNLSNWLSTNAGDALLYACMIETETFLMEPEAGRVALWKNKYEKDILPAARMELARLAVKDYMIFGNAPGN